MRKGFTLIELLVVLALLIIVSVAGFITVANYRSKQSLVDATNQVVAVVHDAQNRSISQQSGLRWGIRFSNATSGLTGYQTFSGTSYSTSSVDRTYYLTNNTQFSEPGTGLNVDEIFNPITGKLTANKIISLVTGKKDGLVGDIILHSQGPITTRQENGLVGYWHFDENTSTTVYDASGIGDNGILQNSPTWLTGSSCKSGSCLNFNVASSSISGNPSVIQNYVSSAMTITAWVYPLARQSLGDRDIIFRQNGYLTITPTGNLSVYFYGLASPGYYDSNGVVPLNVWTHLAVTYDSGSGNINLFINGVLDRTATTTGTIATSQNNFVIGGEPLCCNRFFNGYIDEVRVYNRALSATEILNQYNDIK